MLQALQAYFLERVENPITLKVWSTPTSDNSENCIMIRKNGLFLSWLLPVCSAAICLHKLKIPHLDSFTVTVWGKPSDFEPTYQLLPIFRSIHRSITDAATNDLTEIAHLLPGQPCKQTQNTRATPKQEVSQEVMNPHTCPAESVTPQVAHQPAIGKRVVIENPYVVQPSDDRLYTAAAK